MVRLVPAVLYFRSLPKVYDNKWVSEHTVYWTVNGELCHQSFTLFILYILPPSNWSAYLCHSLTCPHSWTRHPGCAVHPFPAKNHGFKFGGADPHPHHVTLGHKPPKQALKFTAWHGANVLGAGLLLIFTTVLCHGYIFECDWVWRRLRASSISTFLKPCVWMKL